MGDSDALHAFNMKGGKKKEKRIKKSNKSEGGCTYIHEFVLVFTELRLGRKV